MRLKGSDLMVFEKVEDSYKSVAHSKSHTLDLSRSEIDVSDKDDGDNTNTEAGPLTWGISATITGTEETHKKFIDAIIANTVFDLEWNMKADAETLPLGGWTPSLTGGYQGKAILTSVSVAATHGEKVTMDVKYAGQGKFAPKA